MSIDQRSTRKVCIIRRNYRPDGGAEVATSNYADALSRFAEVSLACESWDHLGFRGDVTKLEVTGKSRASNYRSFVQSAEDFVTCFPGRAHSHELIPGVDVIRLGDGLHSSWLDAAGWSWKTWIDPFHRYKVRLEREVLTDPRLKFVIVNSDFVGKAVTGGLNVDPSRLVMIRNIVRQEFKETVISRRPALSMGRLVFAGSGWHRKGLKYAIRALKFLPEEVTLSVYGVDKSMAQYERLVSSNGLQSRVFFRGVQRIAPRDLDQYDAMIHPAIYEPFPNVAVEALSRGLPVVSSHFSGTSDFDKTLGVATCDLSNESLVDGIRWALDCSANERSRFRDHVVQFDQAYLKRSLEHLYESLW